MYVYVLFEPVRTVESELQIYTGRVFIIYLDLSAFDRICLCCLYLSKKVI